MESSGRTLVCSVLFLDIVEYSKKPVSDQLQLKQDFNRVLTKSLEHGSPFHHEGARTDKHVREHDVYSVVGGTPASRRFADTVAQTLEDEATASWLARSGPLGLRRSALLASGVLLLVIVAGGVGARAPLGSPAPEPEPVAPAPAPVTPPAAAPAAPKKEKRAALPAAA